MFCSVSSSSKLYSAVRALFSDPMHVTLHPHPTSTSVVMTLTSPSDLDVNKPSTVEQSVFGPPLYIQTCKYKQLCMLKT